MQPVRKFPTYFHNIPNVAITFNKSLTNSMS